MSNGGRREGAGRKPGSPNKVNAGLAAAAREYTKESLETLAKVMRARSAPHSAKVMAATAMLDRGYGKPKQAIEHSVKPLDLSLLTDEQLDQLARIRRELERDPARGVSNGATPSGGTPPPSSNGSVH